MKFGWWAVQNRLFPDFSKPFGSGAGQGGSFDSFAEIGLTPAPIPAAFRARVYPGELRMKKLTLAVLALGLMAAPSFALDNLGGGKGDGKGPSCEQRAANSTQKSPPPCHTCSYKKAS